jgi:hypothetical protein
MPKTNKMNMNLSVKQLKNTEVILSVVFGGIVYFLLENKQTRKITAKVFSNNIVTFGLIYIAVIMIRTNFIGSIVFTLLYGFLLRKARNIHDMEGMENQSEQDKAASNLIQLVKEFDETINKLGNKIADNPSKKVYVVKGYYDTCPDIFIQVNFDKAELMYGFGKDGKPENKKPFTFQELKKSLEEKCVKNKRFEDLEKFIVSFEPKLKQGIQNQEQAKENTIINIEKENEENESNSIKQENDSPNNTELFLNYYPYGKTETNFIDGQTNVNCSSNCKKTKKQSLSSPCRGYGFFKGGMNAQGLSCPIPGYPGEKFGCPLD